MKLSRKILITAALAALTVTAQAQNTDGRNGGSRTNANNGVNSAANTGISSNANSNSINSSNANNIVITHDSFADRNVEQQRRIEQGLRSGDLNVREASRLEREESRVNSLQARALRDGTVSDAERAQINRAQDRVSQDIARERQDNERGNPNSASSQRMQSDVHRNLAQQERIQQGLSSGQLTNREAARLENGQARSERMQGRAGADGRIDRYEQHRIQGAENHQSRQIHDERRDGQRQHSGDFRQGREGRSEHQYQREGGHRQASGARQAPSFQGNAQQHSFQQRSYAMAGGGGRRGR